MLELLAMKSDDMGSSTTKDKVLTGAAGEYYVAFRLSAEGYAVVLTTHGTRLIDMSVVNPNTAKSITIQTKTMENAFVKSKKYTPYWKWPVGKSHLKARETFFYVFVDLRGDPSQTPDVFIVPSSELDSLLSDNKGWIWCDGIDEDNAPQYRDRWDYIRDALS